MAALLDIVTKGSTDRSVTVRIIDSSDGTPETGVVFNTSGIDLWYRREGETKTSITEADLATPALDDAHADGGFLHVGDGEYRLDLPDAAFATGANHVDVGGTVTGMIVIGGRVRLVDVDVETAILDQVTDDSTQLDGSAINSLAGQTFSTLAVASGTAGADNNDTNKIHLDGVGYADGELDGYHILILNNTTGLYHYALITDFADDSGQELATFSPAMAESVEASTDTYEIHADRKDADIATILADTNELQTDWVNGGRLDLILDALNTDIYHADIDFAVDEANTQDEYTVTWFKNGVRLTSGITSPTIQVVKRADGTDLVASTAMTEIGSTESYKYDEATNRITGGEAVIVIAGATIDGSARSFPRVVSRDSSGS